MRQKVADPPFHVPRGKKEFYEEGNKLPNAVITFIKTPYSCRVRQKCNISPKEGERKLPIPAKT
jgi:hypothetical protein